MAAKLSPPFLGCLVCLFLNKQNYASYLLFYPFLALPLKGREQEQLFLINNLKSIVCYVACPFMGWNILMTAADKSARYAGSFLLKINVNEKPPPFGQGVFRV